MKKIDYDKVSEIYDLVRQGEPLIIRKIIEESGANENSSILEIGCGTGNNTLLISKVTNGTVYGIDQSEGMLRNAIEKNSDINFVKGDAITLAPFEAEKFDVIFMVDVIHHIADIDEMFINIKRVLKPWGKLLIFTNSHDQIKYNRLTSKFFPETVEQELKRYQSFEELFTSIKKSGLQFVKGEDVSYPVIEDMGGKLIALAEKKGFSMFHLISDQAIKLGIDRVRKEMEKGNISYTPMDYMIVAMKV